MKLLRSFRFRLIFLSMLVSALALGFFTLVAWYYLKSQLEASHRQKLEAFLLRSAPQIQRILVTGQRWPESRAFGRMEGRFEQANLFFAYQFSDSSWLYSSNWPNGFSPSLDALQEDYGFAPPVTESREVEATFPRRGDRGRTREQVDDPIFLEVNGYSLAALPTRRGILVIGSPMDVVPEEWARLRTTLLWAFPFALLVVGAGAFFLSSRALRPIRKLTTAAQSLQLDHRQGSIKLENEEVEFAQLIEVFNQMVLRLEKSFQQAKRFTQDASHELNTPLTLLIGQLDELLQETESGSPYQQRLAAIYEESIRLRDIVKKLHILAQADRGGLTVTLEAVSLSAVLKDCMEDCQTAYPHILFPDVAVSPPSVWADSSLLRQVLFNLLSNAAKFNRSNGKVWISGSKAEGRYTLEVWNEGEGIPSELAERVFDRFVRGDASRARESLPAKPDLGGDQTSSGKEESTVSGRDGLGLGLSLAWEMSKAMGGDLQLISRKTGLIGFALTLKVAQAGAEGKRISD